MELCINQPNEAFLETSAGWRREQLPFADFDWCSRLGKVDRQFDSAAHRCHSPLLSASLPTGERVQIVMPPATTAGCVAIAIRRPAERGLEHRGVGKPRHFSRHKRRSPKCSMHEEQELLRLLASSRLRGVHASRGAQPQEHRGLRAHGSGKTTWTKALIREIPARRAAGDHRGCQGAGARSASQSCAPVLFEGRPRASRASRRSSCLESCLRMKPDRILLAELRAEEALITCATSIPAIPGSITSVHATSAELAFEQLVLLVKQNQGGRELARSRHQEPACICSSTSSIQFGVERHERIHQGNLVRPSWRAQAGAGKDEGCQCAARRRLESRGRASLHSGPDRRRTLGPTISRRNRHFALATR
jgi:type IV secretion system protein VirB11